MTPAGAATQTEEPETPVKPIVIDDDDIIPAPPFGTLEFLYHWNIYEGKLPTPINVSITGSTVYKCPELKWYNFDVYPHKIKLTNTGYMLHFGAKWKTERPYLEGGPLYEKHVLSQVHFHWGPDMMEGSDHTVDNRKYPAEMQVTFFRAEYMTQQEALLHPDGVVIVCYLIKHGVVADERLEKVIEGIPRIEQAQTHTKIGPYPMSQLMPMFFEDYFLYWGKVDDAQGNSYAVRWIIPRTTLSASFNQMKQFRKLWNPWDEPNLRNNRPLQERADRHIFFINPHWCQYNSLLPLPRVPEESISTLSPAYKANPWMLPPQNAYMIPKPEPVEENVPPPDPLSIEQNVP